MNADRRPPVQAGATVAEMRGGRMNTVGIPTEKSKDFTGSLRRLMSLMARDQILVVFILLMAVTSVGLTVIGPRVLGHATDLIFRGLFDPNRGVDFSALHATLWVAVGLYVSAFVLSYSQAFVLAGVVQRTMFRMRRDVEAKLHRLPLSYVDRHARGDLLSRVTNDIDNISQSLQQSLSQLVTSLLTILGVTVMMFIVSPILAMIALVTIPLSMLTMKSIAARSRQRFIDQWRFTGELNGLVEESFTGHAIVRVFGRQHETQERFSGINEQLCTAGFGAQFMSGSIQPAMMFIGNLNYVAIAVVGGLRVATGRLSLGDVQSFIQYSRQFTQPLTQTASMFNVLQSGIASAERVFELLDAGEQSPDPVAEVPERGELARIDSPTRGRVVFDHISFSYDPDQPLIRDVSLVAEPGTTVAIVGPTGAGKTTLVNLLMRFYELTGGSITLDERDIATMSRSALRSHVGMVLQDAWLFNGTIRDNIAYGNPMATEDDIRAAARAAYVDRFAHSLPLGYDTLITDDGQSVSAGERQLITIARAFLVDPTILVLDEATSSVDTRTEVLIQRAMHALRAGRTSFVIAHRLSTIRDATIILVMENGAIVEQGSHDDLLERRGAYYRLYQSQFVSPANDIV